MTSTVGLLLGRVHVDRHAAAVVVDPDAAVGEQGDLDAVGVAGQRLVDGVVDDLPHQVVQAALGGRADVHAGALANRLEPLQDLDGTAGVAVRAPPVGRIAVGRPTVGWGCVATAHVRTHSLRSTVTGGTERDT